MRSIRFAIAIAAALLAGGCATGGGSAPAAAAETASERAAARWAALIEGRAGEAWEMYTPGVRSARPQDVYVREAAVKPVKYLRAAPVSEECDADACTVTVEVEYDLRLPLAGAGVHRATAYLEERWIRLDGGWFYLPDDFR